MRCEKCGYESEENKKIEDIYLCSICNQFSPDNDKLKEYLNEKIDWKHLESFRKYSKKTTQGMEKQAKKGMVVSRAAFGYSLIDKNLVPDEKNKLVVQEIYHTFLNTPISLNRLSKQYSLSINGLKKVLRNFTYIGKVKFAGQIMPGNHPAIISPELFNKVQAKLEQLRIK